MTERRADEFLPLRPLVFDFLLLIHESPRHGYGLMQEHNSRPGARQVLGPGTLYRTLREMEGLGLIEGFDGEAAEGPGRDRRYYRITSLGRRVAAAEAHRMAQLVGVAERGRLI